MIDGESVADFTALEEAEDEFGTRDSARDEAVANAGSREDRGWCIGGMETVAGLCIGDTGATHSFGG